MKSPDILSQYGPEATTANRATVGGVIQPKPLDYSKPLGPTEQMRDKPGLGGKVYPCGSQRSDKG